MNTEPKLDELILENISDLDATAKRIEFLGDKLYDEVYNQLASWADHRDWLPKRHLDGHQVMPPEWIQEGIRLSYFSVAWGPGDDEEGKEGEVHFSLSRFAGVGGAKVCLWLNFPGVKPSVWRPLFQESASQAKKLGFSFDDAEGFYIDCTPPLGSLAPAVADDDYTAAFEPLTRALDAAHAAWPLFDALLKKARG